MKQLLLGMFVGALIPIILLTRGPYVWPYVKRWGVLTCLLVKHLVGRRKVVLALVPQDPLPSKKAWWWEEKWRNITGPPGTF